MRSIRPTALQYAYLAVSLFGWLLFGVFARATLDALAAGSADPFDIVATAAFGIVLLVGTPIGYAVLTRGRRPRVRNSERP